MKLESLKRFPFHPLLFGAYPVLSLYAKNTALFPVHDLWLPLAIVLAAVGIVWTVLGLVVRSIDRAAVAVSFLSLAFFAYGPILDVLYPDPASHAMGSQMMIWPWGATIAVFTVVALWNWKRRAGISRVLNITGAVLLAMPLATTVLSWTRGAGVPVSSVGEKVAYSGPRPDVFYILLDGYGRHDVLRREMGYDNSQFLNGLKSLGFYVADASTANYCQTELSLASTLNFSYLPPLLNGISADSADRDVLGKFIDRNRVSQELRRLGYAYIALTTGFPAIDPASADLEIQAQRGGTLFETALLQRTPIGENGGAIQSAYESRAKTLETAVDILSRLGQPASRPRFVFAHILAPHPPFVFDAQGHHIRAKRQFALVDGSHYFQNGGSREEYRKGYAGQAETVSRMLLASLQRLVRSSKTQPIVIIQGDHGPKLNLDQEDLRKTDVHEVFPILNAYLVPEKVQVGLYPGITPVNSFRTILRAQFGIDAPPLPDRNFYSAWSFPYKFVDVTEDLKQ